ncbi:MAG: molybdenum cofactor guanylyltransferase [Bdellovibrio sp.]|nr:molybdenum cofactor guanylyltransferase [Bdellovibrio sp.]
MDNVWGLVLAGGKSSRMGQAKALLPYKGQRLIDSMVSLLAEITGAPERVLVSGKVVGHSCIEDEVPGKGPLEGLRCVLKNIPDGDILVVVPVDMPLLTPGSLKELLLPSLLKENFVRFTESELPCVLVISKKTTDVLSALSEPSVASHKRSVQGFFAQLAGMTVACGNPRVLVNANTPEEWQEIFK